MCGIIGSYSTTYEENIKERMALAVEALRHRGPDDYGVEYYKVQNGILGLGQTRLSIIDLSDRGHQPMQTANGRFSIVFNGEIYIYKEIRLKLENDGILFRSDSDTEVLLQAWIRWGVECLRTLVGMFAFSVYDRELNEIIIVRDAFGIKPLFYSLDKNGFHFSSEIEALAALNPNVSDFNYETIINYLINGNYDETENTFFSGFKHLLPGHIIRVKLDNFQDQTCTFNVQRWWFPSIEENKHISFEEACKEFKRIFLSNLKLHLRSDVPLGTALSGGLDSSAVVCAIRYLEPEMPINTFSYIADDDTYNEEKWVDIVNRHVDAIPNKIKVGSGDLFKDLDDMIKYQGEPFGSTSIYAQYRVFKAAKESGITVMLDGQGADELLAGYHGYPNYFVRSLLDLKRPLDALFFLINWLQWPNRSYKEAFKIFIKELMYKVGFSLNYSNKNEYNAGLFNQAFINQQSIRKTIDNPISTIAIGRRLVEKLRNGLTGQGLTSLLRHADRNSMRWSIESRVPFLTIEMAEFLLSLPESYLVSPKGQTKYLFRESMRGIVPDSILNRKDKIGFVTPEKDWLIQHKKYCHDIIRDNVNMPVVNIDYVRKNFEKLLESKSLYNNKIWPIINLLRWSKLNY